MPDETPDPSDDVAPSNDRAGESAPDLPADVVEEVTRLTRLALDAADRGTAASGPFQAAAEAAEPSVEQSDEAALYRERRDDLLAEYGYAARVREDREGGATLVCYPADWLDEDGIVRLEADLDTDRAVERTLTGPGEQGDFEDAVAQNDALVDAVAAEYGDLHAANVRVFADFMGNHYARPAVSASAAEVREFLEEFYPRNAWPSDEQADAVEQSLRYAYAVRDRQYPLE